MTWHNIKCEGSKKTNVKVPIYNFNKLRRSGRTCYFDPEPKLGAPETVEANPINEGK